MANKIRYNIKNVHYAVATTSGYGTPTAIPGAVSLSVDPKGDESIFYADGLEYWKNYFNNGYEGSLDIAILPDGFRKDVLGDTEDANHVLLEKTGVESKKFALGFQIDGNEKSTLFWFYNCTASRPSTEANTTEDNIAPDTDTLSWSCAPDASGKVRVKTTEAATTGTISGWFTSVYQPSNG